MCDVTPNARERGDSVLYGCYVVEMSVKRVGGQSWNGAGVHGPAYRDTYSGMYCFCNCNGQMQL
jgi:hypothetical protein